MCLSETPRCNTHSITLDFYKCMKITEPLVFSSITIIWKLFITPKKNLWFLSIFYKNCSDSIMIINIIMYTKWEIASLILFRLRNKFDKNWKCAFNLLEILLTIFLLIWQKFSSPSYIEIMVNHKKNLISDFLVLV